MEEKDYEAIISELKRKIERLEDDSVFLQCLQSAGVDNWDGYDYAIKMYRECSNED